MVERGAARNAGFTLLEVILVVAILAMVAAVAVPTVDLLQNRQRSDVTVEKMSKLKIALEDFYQDRLQFPAKLGTLEEEGYIASDFGTGDAFLDGWGNGLSYQMGATTASLTSLGVDQIDSKQNIVLTVDGTRFLLSRTRDDMTTIHTALRNYEAQRVSDELPDLPKKWWQSKKPQKSAMGLLIKHGYLANSTRYVADAWGDTYEYDGSPADYVTSKNVSGS